MHAGTFFGRAWGGVRVFVFGFWASGASDPGHPGFVILAVLDVLLCVNVSCNNVSIAC